MPLISLLVNIDDAAYQNALTRARNEGKSLGDVVAAYLAQYGEGVASGSPTTYTVQRGDTLGRIAARFYGDARKYPIIQRANNISNAGMIWVGQNLLIPPLDGQTAQQPSTPQPPTQPPVIQPPTQPPTTSIIRKPPTRFEPSPHYNQRPNPNDISGITIHATANSTLAGVISWFKNPRARVSAHYTIGKDGTIVQHVRDEHRAWHAGISVWKGRTGCNDFCLGVELVNLNNGIDPYPEAQHRANVNLCAYLCAQYNILVDDIMAHYDISPRRKTDPRGYNMDRLRREVAAKLGRV